MIELIDRFNALQIMLGRTPWWNFWRRRLL